MERSNQRDLRKPRARSQLSLGVYVLKETCGGQEVDCHLQRQISPSVVLTLAAASTMGDQESGRDSSAGLSTSAARLVLPCHAIPRKPQCATRLGRRGKTHFSHGWLLGPPSA